MTHSYSSSIVMALTKSLLVVALLSVAANNPVSAFQKPGGRDTPTPTPTPSKPPNGHGSGSSGPSVPKLQLANMTIFAPPGCRVWINEMEIDSTQPAGALMLNQERVKFSY